MNRDIKIEGQPDAPQMVAVIDIGASSLRMQIAEIAMSGAIRKLESFTQALSLGKDSFSKGRISRDTIENCVHVLSIYRAKLEEYGIDGRDNIRVVATSAVNEASNRLAFQDRVYIATGFEIDSFDEAELHRVTYLGLQPYMQSQPQFFKGETLIVEVGGGTTETMWLSGGNVVHSKSYRLGGLRLRHRLETYDMPLVRAREFMERDIRVSIDLLRESVGDRKPDHMIVMGGDVRFAVDELKQKPLGDEMVELKLKPYEKLLDKVLDRSPENLANSYHMSLPDAQTLGPGLLAHLMLAKEFGMQHIVVANINLRDGLIKEISEGRNWSDSIRSQIVLSALQLGRKYNFRESNAVHVAGIACSLFDQLQVLHQVPNRFRGLLRLAGLLFDIGSFISNRSRHKHSLYLINNSPFFGIGSHEKQLIGLIARYHRSADPSARHTGYSSLSREKRVAVVKLAALLRIAIAIDVSQKQRIEGVECRLRANQVEIIPTNDVEISLEQLETRSAGRLFEEIFGKPAVLLAQSDNE